MTFQEWFNSAPHRAKYTKYSNDHPVYLAAQEAWEAAHEACAKVCDSFAESEKPSELWTTYMGVAYKNSAAAIRARGQS